MKAQNSREVGGICRRRIVWRTNGGSLMGRFGAQEILLLLLIVLLLFGAARLPRLARSLREAREEFQKESSESPEPAPTDPEPK
jgi:sec-independent protein translocase protein TatA